MSGIREQRRRIRVQALDHFNRNEDQVERNANGKSAPEIGMRMVMVMAMIVMMMRA